MINDFIAGKLMITDEKILTFVIPSHNDFKRLADAIELFLQIDVDDVCMIVVESSTYESVHKRIGEVCDNRVSFLYGAKNGIYDAINRGVKAVKTQYYIVIGLDDKFNYKKLNTIILNLRYVCPDLLFLGVRKAGRLQQFYCPQNLPSGPQGVFPSHTGGSIIKKDLHEKYGIYDEDFDVVADGLFLCRAILGGCDACYLDGVYCEIGAAGYSKLREIDAEIQSYKVRVKLGVEKADSVKILVLRLSRRVLKRFLEFLHIK